MVLTRSTRAFCSGVSTGMVPISRDQANGRHAVGAHLEAGHVERDRLRQPDDAELGGGVVGLAEVADQAGRGGEVDEGAGLLVLEVGRRRLRHVEGAVEVHLDDGVPVDRAHAVEDAVAQDAGVVDHAVDAAEVVDRRLDDALGALRVGDAVAVGHRRAAGLLDLADHLIRDRDVGALALGRAAEIVDHHLGALGGGQHGDLPPDAPPRAGDDDDLTVYALVGHDDLTRRLGRASAMTQHKLPHENGVGSALRLTQPTLRHAPYLPTMEMAQTLRCGKPPRLCVRPKIGSWLRWRSPARPCICRYIS